MAKRVRDVVTCVLFDMDGLLLDTENLYTQGTQKILSEYGKTYSWEFKAQLMGKHTNEVASMIVDHYSLPMKPQDWVERSKKVYDEMFPNVKALPGVTRLVHHLAKHNVPIGVATSSSSSSFTLKTEKHSGLFSLFDRIVKGDSPGVEKSKPNPDIFLVAANHLGCDPATCLVVEDAPLGVQAGLAAGMQVLMVPHPNLEPALTKDATVVLQSLQDIKPEIFGLPPFPYKPVSHVIFDMDGLLLSTQEMYSQTSALLLSKFGKQPDWDFKMKVIGRKAEVVADMAVAHYGIPLTGSEYLKMHEVELHKLFPTCCLLPGVEKLLRHLYKNKIPIAVATSSSRASFELKTSSKHKEIFSLFSHITTGCDAEVKSGKPDPQIYQVCRARFSDSPAAENCLVFEDAPNGVQAGLAAGMQVVMIPHHKVQKDLLMPATQVLATMEDFKPEDFGLPPYEQ